MGKSKNHRFNRLEFENRHEYLTDFSAQRDHGSAEYEAYIKCKLIHAKWGSVIIPDQIFFERKAKLYWIQPLFFGPNHIQHYSDTTNCTLWVDASFGKVLEVGFRSRGFVRSFSDGSELYKCKVKSTNRLERHFTGLAKWGDDNRIKLKIYHHTKKKTVSDILESGFFYPSAWNIQGNKKLKNIGYVYFTSLNSIQHHEDLQQIAMAHDGEIPLRLDQNYSASPDHILNVYRENTLNRRSTLNYWVDSSLLAPQPVYKHSHPGEPVYYEIVGPFIHRVGIEQDSVLDIEGDSVETQQPKRFDYLIVGDATTVEGLIAPYDEENTEDIFKVEKSQLGASNILDFWIAEANQDHFSGKVVEKQEVSDEDS